jgi:septal ring factor EnvC (AmiA/AmiB activator)
MTGGGRAKRGLMGTKVTAGLVNDSQPDNTPQMKKSIEEYERRVAKLVPSIATLEKQEEKIRNQIYRLEDEHKLLSMDIQVSELTIVTCNVANSPCFTAFDEKCACA